MRIQEAIREGLLDQIRAKGWICDNNLHPEDEIELRKLEFEGVIESLRSAGIEFMNEDYFFILKGNPDNVHVFQKDRCTFTLRKG